MKKVSGIRYMLLAMAAFAGLGLEILLAFIIEPAIYGAPLNGWSDWQNIMHWVATCILWGAVSWYIVQFAKKTYRFDIFQKGSKVAVWQWLLLAVIVAGSLILSYFDWNGSKVLKEFYANGPLKFVFQYIYYFFETILVLLILVFSQNAFETWFRRRNIPYGGIIAAATWGTAHFFTKDFSTGIITVLSGLAFGSVYLLVNRDIRKAYPVLWILFVL